MKKAKNLNAFLLLLSALFSLSLLTSCSTDNPDTQGKATEQITEAYGINRPGEYFTDKVSSLKLGDKEFDLPLDFDGFKAIFGDEMTVWYSKENDENHELEKYIFDDYIFTSVVQDGVYTAELYFIHNMNTKKYDFYMIKTVNNFILADKDTASNISYTENGEIKIKDFPIEADKVIFSIDGLATGTATKEQIDKLIGEGEVFDHSDKGYILEAYYFEDYKMTLYYDTSQTFIGAYIFIDTDKYTSDQDE